MHGGISRVFYTDGSKTEHGSGKEVYLSDKNENRAFFLGQYETVFQAEGCTIPGATTWVTSEGQGCRRKKLSAALTNAAIKNKEQASHRDNWLNAT